MIEFLIIMGLVWLVAASVVDVRKREIPNWLSFSLIIIVVVYRVLISLFVWDSSFLVQGVIGLGIFVGLGYLFYYSRLFAGGDAKLLMGLGGIIAFTSVFINNLFIFITFLFLMFASGAVYGLVFSLVLMSRNLSKFKSEFRIQIKKYKKLFYVSVLFAVFLFLVLIIFRFDLILYLFPLLVLLFPLMLAYGKAIEEACMIRALKPGELTEGDWLYENIKIGSKIIKPHWEGLSVKDINLIKGYKKKILIKQGIPFVPVFLIAYLVLIGLWYSGWEFWKLFYFFSFG